MKLILSTIALSVVASGAAFAGSKCDVPVGEWQPRAKLQSQLEQQGWKIRSIKTEDGCYEAYAMDAGGKKVEAYFNPKTLERVNAKSSD